MGRGQECTVIKGSRILQVMNSGIPKGVLVPKDDPVLLGDPISNERTTELNNINFGGFNIDWTGSYNAIIKVDFDDGTVQTLELIVKPSDIKDCK